MSDFYKMDPAAWDFGTANLTLEQEAAYLRIVNAMHKHKGPVPDNDRVLAGLFRSSTRKARSLVKALVDAGKVKIDAGYISNDRAVSDLVHRGFVSISRAESGAKGGRTRAERAAKALKDNNPHQAIGSSREEKSREEIRDVGKPTSVQAENLDACLGHFNAIADRVGWPKVQRLTATRKAALVHRISDIGGEEAWRDAMDRAARSPFLTGQTGRGWRADFDWLCKAANFTKLCEGNYDPRPDQPRPGLPHQRGPSGAHDSMVAGFAFVAHRDAH